VKSNPQPVKKLAPLKIIAASLAVLERVRARPRGDAGMGVIYGPPGLGKTETAIHLQNKTGGILLTGADHLTRRTFLEGLLMELREFQPRGDVARLTNRALELLAEEPDRPLIIDEADKLVDRRIVETVRYLYDNANVPVILIGEDALPHKMRRVERFYDRVRGGAWLPAPECDLEDTRKLATIFAPGLTFSDATLDRIRILGKGRVRRIGNSLEYIAEWARLQGAKSADAYSGELDTGEPPARVRPLAGARA
jgi:DNA transposition AAA+ family ATPase